MVAWLSESYTPWIRALVCHGCDTKRSRLGPSLAYHSCRAATTGARSRKDAVKVVETASPRGPRIAPATSSEPRGRSASSKPGSFTRRHAGADATTLATFSPSSSDWESCATPEKSSPRVNSLRACGRTGGVCTKSCLSFAWWRDTEVPTPAPPNPGSRLPGSLCGLLRRQGLLKRRTNPRKGSVQWAFMHTGPP